MQNIEGFDFFPLKFDEHGTLRVRAGVRRARRRARSARRRPTPSSSRTAFATTRTTRRVSTRASSRHSERHLSRPEFARRREPAFRRRRRATGRRSRFAKTTTSEADGTRGLQESRGSDGRREGAARGSEGATTPPAQRRSSKKRSTLLPTLEHGMPTAQDEFVALVLSLVDTRRRSTRPKGCRRSSKRPGSELLARLSPPAADGTRGIGDVFGTIAGGVGQFLNLTTWYVMKERSGTVGANGRGRRRASAARQLPESRLHLVGHSLGGRLMAGCAKALGEAPKVQPDSLMLLEAAFSHFGFSPDNGHGNAGFFRDVDQQADRQGTVRLDLLRPGHGRRQGVLDHVAARRRQHQGDRRCVRRVRRHRPEWAAEDDRSRDVRLNQRGNAVPVSRTASSTISTDRAASSRTMAT